MVENIILVVELVFWFLLAIVVGVGLVYTSPKRQAKRASRGTTPVNSIE